MSLEDLSLCLSHILHCLFLQHFKLLFCLCFCSHVAGYFCSRILNGDFLHDLLCFLINEKLSNRNTGKYALTLTSFHETIPP